MTQVLTDKAIQQLIEKTKKKAKGMALKGPWIDPSIVRDEPADNQEDLDAQFAFAKKREF